MGFEAKPIGAVGGFKEGASEAERDGESLGAEPVRLAGIVRGHEGAAVEGAGGADIKSHGHAAGRVGPVLEEFDEVLAGEVVIEVECGEVHLVLGGRGDAALVGAVEGVFEGGIGG